MAWLQARWWADTSGGAASRAWLASVAKTSEALASASVPACFPLAVGDRVICRGHGGIFAFDLASGRLLWRTPTPLGLDGMLGDPTYNKAVQFKDWAAHQANARDLVLQNTTLGTLSSDGSRVYAVEDLVLPPPPEYLAPTPPGQPGHRIIRSFGPKELKDAVYHSRLRAIDLASGRLVWEAGGRGEKGLVDDAYFLGPPVPVAGLLYAVIEKKREVRLVCLHPNSGQALWSQLLAETRDQILLEPGRRGLAAQPALGDGILVCPTNTGALVAVDLLSRRLAWAYAYPRNTQNVNLGDQNPTPVAVPTGPSWQAAAPVVQAGKVIYTPPDSDVICCVNLRDGKEVWQAKRGDDLYLAGVQNGRVVLVGRSACRALNLATGAEAWQTPAGLPSGVGTFSGGSYFLPLRKGAVVALDVETGRLVASSQSSGGEVPGNLLFHQGEVLSQTATRITTYPQLTARLAQLDKHLGEHPADSAALMERASLRLNQGQADAALVDLRGILVRKPTGPLRTQVRGQIYEALATLRRAHEQPPALAPILKQINQEWQVLVEEEDADSAERFVAYFGDLAPIGPEARLRVAEWWLDGKAAGSGLEAELHLVRLRDQRGEPRLAVRATEALARLYARKGHIEDSLECYRALGRDHADVVVRDGRTGGDLAREIDADRRFLPYLDDTGYAWPGGRIRAQVMAGRAAKPSMFIPIEPEGGEAPAYFRRYQLGMDVNQSRFVLLDRATGVEVWSHRDPCCQAWKSMISQQPQDAQDFSLPCRVKGHLVVIGVGPVMFGFDLLNRRVLWQKDLVDVPSIAIAQQRPDLFNFEWVGPMSTGCVCLQCESGLYGIDPLLGTVLWTRADVYPNTQGFGDEEHVYLVEADPGKPAPQGAEPNQRGDRAIRLRDGAVVKVPSFLQAHTFKETNWVGMHPPLGRCLVDGIGNDLFLHDAHTGKRVWERKYSEGNRWEWAVSTISSLVAVLENGERIVILDAATGKPVMTAKVNPKDFENNSGITLLQDRLHYYIVVAPSAVPQNQNEQFEPNVTHGLETVPAGGKIYAFDRNTGKLKWDVATLTHPSLREPVKPGTKSPDRPIRNLNLVLERFEESPLLILTTARQRPNQQQPPAQPAPGGMRNVPPAAAENKTTAVTVAIDKVSGKLIHAMIHFDSTRPHFHAVQGDPRGGSIDFVSADRTIRFTHEEGAGGSGR
jgi:outer membrane protein assembly factor BamB